MSHIWVIESLAFNDDKWRPFHHSTLVNSRKRAREWVKDNKYAWPLSKFRVRKYERCEPKQYQCRDNGYYNL